MTGTAGDMLVPQPPPPGGRVFGAVIEAVGFEPLRASLGFAAASAVMQALAERVSAALAGCAIGRIGRATVEVAFALAADMGPAAVLAAVRGELEKPIAAAGIELRLSIAIGVAPSWGLAIDGEVLDRAASGLAAARPATGMIGVAATGGSDAALGDLALIQALHAAIAGDTLSLHYQPKLHCRDDRVTSIEALLRWTHPRYGTMPIDRVIEVAERVGVIDALTRWVVGRALADQAALAAAGHRPRIFVNLSGKLLGDRAFIADLLAGIPADASIGFEITETAVIDDPDEAIANVDAIAAAGHKVAIDDYGSGLSSLAYLKRLTAHELKIDRLFISNLVNDHRDPLLVRSSIDLAHALEMEVTAEGVDDPMTLSLLRVMGCDTVQGFLIAPALPLRGLIAFLDAGDRLLGLGRGLHRLPEAGRLSIVNGA